MPADLKSLKQDLTRRMDGALETLRKEFAGLRTGRASPALLEPIRVEAYGTEQPLNQVANISVAGPGLLSVQVWDRAVAKAVEIAIRDAGLGLNPQAEGQVIRVPLPPLTTERRNELAKMASKYAEGSKVAIRGVRRDGMEQVKAAEKDKKAPISQDEAKDWSDEVQKLTDHYIKLVDQMLAEKEKDIRQV
ncbi:ribosome recycling factor [Siccirubricoccus sp. KC 17139]|uniref:Ribosome-recycling factor n=1 Tax=Siccirubricoccus soli TaxID=2899147 RepID=A0ABT1DAV6_9PROT|nr:ribosome recycling factor [Siccirubricoccus soli]MCO6419075.1 ribosome recycling factor [Siccirubricoccus soli]MCP2685210.1 ribosome recycling factor [Siccirubricoccus soli]